MKRKKRSLVFVFQLLLIASISLSLPRSLSAQQNGCTIFLGNDPNTNIQTEYTYGVGQISVAFNTTSLSDPRLLLVVESVPSVRYNSTAADVNVGNDRTVVTLNIPSINVIESKLPDADLSNLYFRLMLRDTDYFASVPGCENDLAVLKISCPLIGGQRQCGPLFSPGPDTPYQDETFVLCDQISDLNEAAQQECKRCETDKGVWTAIGCIKTEPKSIVQRFIELGLGLGGGIALLTTIAGGFILTTSQGNPQRADSAKEMITASVVGLLFIIFSVVILQFIGVTILRIPGFGAP